MVLSRHAASEDELHAATRGQSAVLDGVFGDASRLVSLEHLTAKQFQIGAILSIIISTALGQAKALVRTVNTTNRSSRRVRRGIRNRRPGSHCIVLKRE